MKNRISFIHCADIHLDAPFSVMGRENYSTERRKDLKKTLKKIIDMVLKHDTDFLVIAGDLYEHEYVARNTVIWINEQLKRLNPKPVIIVPGNHDPYVKNSWYRSYSWNDNVHILTTENPEYFCENIDVYFYGIGFDTFHQDKIPVQKPPVILPNRFNICLFHGTVDMEFTQSAYNPVESSYLTSMGFDYYALGHFHSKNETLMEKGVINPGSPEPLGFDEKGEHGVYLVELTKQEALKRECTFVKTSQRAYYEIDFNVDGVESCSELAEKLIKSLSAFDYQKDILKINLKGRLNSEFHIDLKTIEQELNDKCFSVKINDYTRPMYDLEELAADKTLTGVFVRKMNEKIEKADGEERQMLERALYLGLEALIEGTVEIST